METRSKRMSSTDKNGVARNDDEGKNDDDGASKKEDTNNSQSARIKWQSKEDEDDSQDDSSDRTIASNEETERSASWLKKLRDMARRLEDTLYRHAKSKEEYMNAKTLKMRLQEVARRMGARVKKNSSGAAAAAAAEESGAGGDVENCC